MKFEMNTIIHGDCLEIMKQVPDKYFDLVLTDPPYGIMQDAYRENMSKNLAPRKKYCVPIGAWDKQSPSKKHFDEILRISKKAIIFGANHFIDLIPYRSSCWIVWDKDNGDSNFADCELAWTNFNTAVRKYVFRWNGMLQQDMMNKEERFHPTQKPVELFKDLIRDYGIKNGYKTVFDPFMGSGTTAVACKSLGIDFIGCELEPDYVAIANKRLEAVQGSLF